MFPLINTEAVDIPPPVVPDISSITSYLWEMISINAMVLFWLRRSGMDTDIEI